MRGKERIGIVGIHLGKKRVKVQDSNNQTREYDYTEFLNLLKTLSSTDVKG